MSDDRIQNDPKQADLETTNRPAAQMSGETHGGHEVDAPPSMWLFKVIAVLSVLLIVAGFGVREVYQLTFANLERAGARGPAPELEKLRETDGKEMSTFGVVDAEAGVYRMPVERARELLLENPDRLSAAPPPEGFQSPDQQAAGTTGDDTEEEGIFARTPNPLPEPRAGRARDERDRPGAEKAPSGRTDEPSPSGAGSPEGRAGDDGAREPEEADGQPEGDPEDHEGD